MRNVRLIGQAGEVLIEGHLAVAVQLDDLVLALDSGRWRLENDDGTLATKGTVLGQPHDDDETEQPAPDGGAG